MASEPESEPDDGARLDPHQFLKQLAPDQLGQFEPLSGMMLLNISEAEFQATTARWLANQCNDWDVDLLRAVNHESYHFAQTVASGYLYERQCRAFTVLNGAADLQPENTELAGLEATLAREAGDDPELKRRAANMLIMLRGHEHLRQLEARAAPGDHSLAGALIPRFFSFQEELAATEAEPNEAGLSILAVLEGSAVVHAELLMKGLEGARERVEAQLATLPPEYRVLVDLSLAHAGERAFELLLPATALALRYARPHDAYLPLFALLAASAPGEAIERGRALCAELPALPGAGPVLGTALDVHGRPDTTYRVYAPFLEELAKGTWGIDSYLLLADPRAMHRLPSFPLGLLNRDEYRGPMDRALLAGRMALMALVLRVKGRRRDEQEFRKWQVAWAQEVLGRLVSGP